MEKESTMEADTQILENILTQVEQLPAKSRLRLVQQIIQTLIAPPLSSQSQPLRFGEFGGDEARMSTLEDFAIAEWRPTDEELDGP
jgi:hypothetical protein